MNLPRWASHVPVRPNSEGPVGIDVIVTATATAIASQPAAPASPRPGGTLVDAALQKKLLVAEMPDSARHSHPRHAADGWSTVRRNQALELTCHSSAANARGDGSTACSTPKTPPSEKMAETYTVVAKLGLVQPAGVL